MLTLKNSAFLLFIRLILFGIVTKENEEKEGILLNYLSKNTEGRRLHHAIITPQ
jgi:hypothetical protein